MKQIWDDRGKKDGFTIVELLTVMSIIILLISLLVPALNRVRRYAQGVKQRAQFHSITVALDLFNAENEEYPDSNGFDDDTPLSYGYCGAMKLAEAMVGQDLKGFNPKSRFRRSGYPNLTPPPALWLGMPYPPTGTCGGAADAACYSDNLKSRKMHLQLENANAFQLADIYLKAVITGAGFDPNTFVLCDIYTRITNRNTGKKMGMPILYYRADVTKTKFPLLGQSEAQTQSELTQNMYIYDAMDNQNLIDMGLPWSPGPTDHPLGMNGRITTTGITITNWPNTFYDRIRNLKIPGGKDRPYREDSYILLSAGFDGEYGTSDDIFNFGE
jgi:competence protein ComGC